MSVSEQNIRNELINALGKDSVYARQEERYIYSRIPAGFRVGEFDYLVLPKGAEEVQKIVMIANKYTIPVIPVGAGLSLSDLTVPIHRGIVMDMRKMDKILEVNEKDKYAVIEPGVTVGQMIGYLKKNYPELRISIPDAPPSATVCGNLLIFGSGHLSRYGPHSDMINNLEVVLHSGERCTLSRLPFPDMGSLFTYWFGTTGIVTKLSVKLYVRHQYRSLLIFKVENPDCIPNAIRHATSSGLIEDVLLFAMTQKESHLPLVLLQIFLTGDSEEDILEKKDIFIHMFSDWNKRGNSIIPVDNNIFPDKFIDNQLMEPKYGIEDAVDLKKGGGCGYLGANFPLSSIPDFFKRGLEISRKYDFYGPLYTIRNIGMGHSVIYNIMYPFNRSDPKSIEITKKAMAEASEAIEEFGGIEWKPPVSIQRHQLDRMDEGTKKLIEKLQKVMNPNAIFNPGNWEIRR